jgi:xanthine dehydrogenase YagR molybdenum-binding subunit
MRDGDWLVGWGCATACYPTQISPAEARVRLASDGSVRVSIAAHEIGNGAYTVIGQAAAECLGLGPDKVTVYLGDSALPAGPVASSSNTTASTTTVVVGEHDDGGGESLRLDPQQALLRSGRQPARRQADRRLCPRRRADHGGQRLRVARGPFRHLGQSVIEEYAESIPRSMSPNDTDKLSGHAGMTGGPKGEKPAFTFGARFVEVRVHALTGEIRVPRAVGAFAAGRIMNPHTARSQLMGGIVWGPHGGLSAALHEATEIDQRTARYVNTNLADYLIPVNADIQNVEVLFVTETDDWVNPLGVKGLGELGNVPPLPTPSFTRRANASATCRFGWRPC